MEIDDAEILEMTDITVDMELSNAVYVVMHVDDRISRKIKVSSHNQGYKLVCQLLAYQEELFKENKDGRVN